MIIFNKRLNLENSSTLVEHKAIELLDSYSGANNYILYLKQKKEFSGLKQIKGGL